MAYSSVRVQFEIGHEASVRTKKTPDGFTHDWEVFVKGADNTDIQYFVDKVVFHLHETFPKPRRVIKEPPYVVKESGYAGFVLPIDVYLKNKEEPKKISFQYDLTLQNSGPPISRVLREPRVFQNPSEDFRRKLIRGGGVGVDTPNEIQTEDHKPSSSLSKPKTTESPSRKHKPELKLNDSFAELFGTPIRRITPEPKKISEHSRKLVDLEKDKKKPVKSHKDEKELPKDKDKYTDRDRGKERDKNKDKLPKPLPPPPPQPVKSKEDHKKHDDKERKKEDYDEKKKRKEEREKKEKHKENKELEKQVEKEVRKEKKEPRDNDYIKKLNSSKSHENRAPSDKNSIDILEKEKERSEKEKHKHRHKKKEKEKNREKEKHKKDKEKNDHNSKERNREKEKLNKKRHDEIKEKEDRIRKKSRTPSSPPERMKKGPLNALLVELGSSDSASPLSEDEDSIPSFKLVSKAPAKAVPENKTKPTVNMSPKVKSTNLNSSSEIRAEKDMEKHQKLEEISLGKSKRDRSPGKKNKKNDIDVEKRRVKEHRRRSTSSDRDDEEGEKQRREREEADLFEKEQEKERLDEEKAKQSKRDKESNRKRKKDKLDQSGKFRKEIEVEDVTASQSLGMTEPLDVSEDTKKPEKFTKEYVAQLKDLQRRIMTLEDNDDLQKVVEVIAETGQYEITKKTFDFDLCALDGDTIRRLQEFFSLT